MEYLFTGNLRVTAQKDSTLAITPLGLGDFLGGFEEPGLWYAVEPLLFSRPEGAHDIAFLLKEKGVVAGLASGAGYHSVYKKLAWHEAPHLQTALLIIFLLIFIAFVAVWSYKLLRGKIGELPLLRWSACYFKRWPTGTWVHFFILSLTSLGFSGWLHYWTVLGFHF